MGVLFAIAVSLCDPATVETKIAHIHDTLVNEQHRMHIWSWTWGSIYGTAAVAQGTAIAFVDAQKRIDLGVGVGSAIIGTLSLFLLPLRVTVPITGMRERWNATDRCAVLSDAEDTFIRAAAAEAQASSWVGHAGNVVFNIGLTLLLGLVFNHWQAGLISGGIGIVIGELNLLTQPARLPSALDQYHR